MIELRAVRFQNLGSFGNELHEIRLDKTPQTLSVGRNGSGKSGSILDTIVYGLYGKPFRKIKIGQLVNSITCRDMLVEVDLSSRGHDYTIRRGHKPSVFEIIRDGEPIDMMDKNRDTQDWLEKTVLMMDQKTFTQIVILGSSNHVPFMKLTLPQRREVVEDILDIQVFSAMNQVLKERVSGVKEEMAERDKALAVAVRELEVEERHLQSLQRDVEKERRDLQEQLKKLEEEDVRVKKQIESSLQQSQGLTDSIKDLESVRRRIDDLKTIRSRLTEKTGRIRKEADFYRSNDHCPTCLQPIQESFKCEKIEESEEQVSNISSALEELDARLSEAQARMDEIVSVQKKADELDREYISAKSELSSIHVRSADLTRRIKALDEESRADEGVIEELRERVSQLSGERDETRRRAKTMAHGSLLLRDQGVKARIVSRYIPLMNRLVNKYLSQLELFVDFQLDENFNETIKSRHRDTFSYSNFSEGERSRIDLAILFAWRDIARMRNSTATDLLIFDEVLDSSLDGEGIDYFLQLIRNMTDGTHVFIISHREGVEDKFERVLKFEKKSNFSRFLEAVDISRNQE